MWFLTSENKVLGDQTLDFGFLNIQEGVLKKHEKAQKGTKRTISTFSPTVYIWSGLVWFSISHGTLVQYTNGLLDYPMEKFFMGGGCGFGSWY